MRYSADVCIWLHFDVYVNRNRKIVCDEWTRMCKRLCHYVFNLKNNIDVFRTRCSTARNDWKTDMSRWALLKSLVPVESTSKTSWLVHGDGCQIKSNRFSGGLNPLVGIRGLGKSQQRLGGGERVKPKNLTRRSCLSKKHHKWTWKICWVFSLFIPLFMNEFQRKQCDAQPILHAYAMPSPRWYSIKFYQQLCIIFHHLYSFLQKTTSLPKIDCDISCNSRMLELMSLYETMNLQHTFQWEKFEKIVCQLKSNETEWKSANQSRYTACYMYTSIYFPT